jgi:hypothetical protein
VCHFYTGGVSTSPPMGDVLGPENFLVPYGVFCEN